MSAKKHMTEGLNPKTAKTAAAHAQLEDFARQYGTALRLFFRRRGAASDVCDDLVQDVFIRLVARASGGEIKKSEAYLMVAASNVWKDFLRKKQTHSDDAHCSYEDAAHSPEGFSPERVFLGKEAVQRLASVLEAMPARTRNIYLLCRAHGFKRAEVAERLGVALTTVDRHLMTAAEIIGAELGDLK